MPKLKSHRGAAKRFKSTSSGRFKRSKAYTSHILTKKTTKRKRKLDTPTLEPLPRSGVHSQDLGVASSGLIEVADDEVDVVYLLDHDLPQSSSPRPAKYCNAASRSTTSPYLASMSRRLAA